MSLPLVFFRSCICMAGPVRWVALVLPWLLCVDPVSRLRGEDGNRDGGVEGEDSDRYYGLRLRDGDAL